MMYPIIIVDIAPMIPGGLMHFNWPRLPLDKPIYRVYQKTYHKMVTIRAKMSATGNTENDTFSLGLIMLKN